MTNIESSIDPTEEGSESNVSNTEHEGQTVEITVATRQWNRSWTFFKYPVTRKLGFLMYKLILKRGYHASDKFMFNGRVIRPHDTPASLGMVQITGQSLATTLFMALA
ncbi:hypothetical protein BKA70DRAFT_1430532 [Coprinopsis sp. MPI-PUGE-AT-0042]|nr:hypothetical protein BKA70DRAFT_1430532 [Coprinopsis sp. MPI-PUGE-AT-0042]